MSLMHHVARLALGLALLLPLTGCGEEPLAPVPNTPLIGRWGGEEAGLIALQGVAEVSLNCGAAVSIAEPLILNSTQAFHATGVLVGTNARVPPSVPVAGTLSGTTLTLTLGSPESAAAVHYVLRAGVGPHFADVACQA